MLATMPPRTTFDSPTLEFDFPGVAIGVAEYDEGPTGCTVFHFTEGSTMTALDARGGVKLFAGDYQYEGEHECDAICLAGGSIFGLEAASGVSAGLFAKQNYALDYYPRVNGAIIYDFNTRSTPIYPDKNLGMAALEAARPGVFPYGARGAGRAASVGSALADDWTEASGQGAAFRQIDDVKIAVFVVLNASGIIHDRSGEVLRGNRNPATGQRLPLMPEFERRLLAREFPYPARKGNSTLSVLITNKMLDAWRLEQLARQVHGSMSRIIQPFHTVDDNDVFFAVSTGTVDSPLATSAVGLIASDLMWDAVARCFD